MVAQHIGFGVIAAMMAVAAVRVVTTRYVVHAALWLVVVLAGVAAQFILLSAEFVAATQVLVYIGAVVVLFLFGTMLTRAKIGGEDQLTSRQWGIGIATALLLAGTMSAVLIDAFHAQKLPTAGGGTPTELVSDSIFSTYLIPFWVLSIVLLAALVGAIVLARRD
jgi:NADH-quinone oxidoreductase subunit J